jgi:hypothetical protein
MTILDVFEGLEANIMKYEELQIKNTEMIESYEYEDTKLKWSSYGSTVVGIIGAPFSGYSLALTAIGGSL